MLAGIAAAAICISLIAGTVSMLHVFKKVYLES